MSSLFEAFTQALKSQRLVAMATIIAGPGLGRKLLLWPDGRTQGSLGEPALDARIQEEAMRLMAEQRSERLTIEADGQSQPWEIFIDVQAPPPQLVIVGAVHIAIPLVTFAKALGFHTIVLDARSAFATPERFGHADELIIQWPADALADLTLNESTYIAVLSHDEKLDNPALQVALKSPARYIGALGSAQTHARRIQALQAEGFEEAQLARIHSPIGLELGGRRPEEIAVAIIAEIVAVMNGEEETWRSG